MEAIIHKNIVRFFRVHNIKIGNEMAKAILTEFMSEGSIEDFLKKTSKHFIKPLDILSIDLDAATGIMKAKSLGFEKVQERIEKLNLANDSKVFSMKRQ